MKPIFIGCLCVIIVCMLIQANDIHKINKRLDALEHKYETSGIIVNGYEYSIIPNLFPTNAVEYYKNK